MSNFYKMTKAQFESIEDRPDISYAQNSSATQYVVTCSRKLNIGTKLSDEETDRILTEWGDLELERMDP